ncbi:MAG: hemerythrin domain-containing protein [Lentisphaerae bacterium]|nr:hemerythrin domain-containing protein [Lentisphaerota bacterium]
MDKMLGRQIKGLIDDYPKVGEILDEYDIGCVPCSVGTCLLKDIVDIHNLAPETEQKMMTRIARVIYPDRDIQIPLRERKATSTKPAYSPPLHKLVEEHKWIKRWAALIPVVTERADVATEEGRTIILAGVDFIRSYADQFHHAKEEDILFTYFDPDLDMVKVMLTDHETARAHVRAVVAGVEQQDAAAVREHLLAYGELLFEHIKKEDDILYPWMDRQFSDSQVGQLFTQFREVDERFGEAPRLQQQFIQDLETRWETTAQKGGMT